MVTNLCKQLDNCLKDVHKSSPLTCVLKHCMSHQELHVTHTPPAITSVCDGHSDYS